MENNCIDDGLNFGPCSFFKSCFQQLLLIPSGLCFYEGITVVLKVAKFAGGKKGGGACFKFWREEGVVIVW